ncbi:pyruvate, water dikinase regulatory protein [Acetobacter nitrogenifigens]|uniref:Putative pyruvate, phosphate dikinase regulatory protein n=1 Tax=Acetobacter nitrogenifigens DSM 23921 = NBRC 105050 TaxID=1120919 RepID=A0A511X844_9PROT|nr:pyruvate, water dikinase regulatory protein [Acetobacter nitrogenifigens]GEN59116.1 putative pyruvate, phosphate dikinase regulatory protein [Acetobacter nitrogenifigens DSM 23921 = NBRC 105050]
MPHRRILLHLVSGATGQTLDSMLRACVAQFPEHEFEFQHWNLIRTRNQLRRALTGIASAPGPVLSSLTEPDLQQHLEEGCARLGVRLLDVMTQALTLLQDVTGSHASGRPGGQYVMDDNYYRRIDAMHFVVEHDDGQQARELKEADVVLVGVSRSSKTPTCFYLANRGIKAANVPLVMERPLPDELFSLDIPVIGLTIDPDSLVEIRRTRVSSMVPTKSRMDMALNESRYVDPEEVRAELLWARRLCARHGWPVVDVTRRSVEETSAAILDILEHPAPAGLPG